MATKHAQPGAGVSAAQSQDNPLRAYPILRAYQCPRTKNWLDPDTHKTADYTAGEAEFLQTSGAIGDPDIKETK